MAIDGMARDTVPTAIAEQLSRVDQEASSLSELLREHGLESTETPIYIATDEIRDEIQAEKEQKDEEQED